MIEIKNLSKSYKKFLAVKNVSFNVQPGKITLLLGPNGAGKSTIIKSISGLLDYLGTVEIEGLKNNSLEAKKLFSYVSEIPYLFEYLTIREHITFIQKAYNITDTKKDVDYYLKLFNLDDKQHKLGKELSKGMSQKLSIILGVISNPKYLFFDEPLIGLDPLAIKECKNLFKDLKNSNVGVLVSTHIIDTFNEIWDEVIILNKGIVILQKSREEFYLEYPNNSLEEIFLDITKEEK